MIVVVIDTSVWVEYFNGLITPETDKLDDLLSHQQILMGDLILGEILQGFREDADFERARAALSHFFQGHMVSPDLAVKSASNFRKLRKKGITVRKTIDCFIATYCIENNHELLHNDRDFDAFETHLGLAVIHP